MGIHSKSVVVKSGVEQPRRGEAQMRVFREGFALALIVVLVEAVAAQTAAPPADKQKTKSPPALVAVVAPTSNEPTDFSSPAEVITAGVRHAWCSALAPDET